MSQQGQFQDAYHFALFATGDSLASVTAKTKTAAMKESIRLCRELGLVTKFPTRVNECDLLAEFIKAEALEVGIHAYSGDFMHNRDEGILCKCAQCGAGSITKANAEIVLDEINEIISNPGTSFKSKIGLITCIMNSKIKPLKVCKGEAHSNAYIDHCLICAPRYGLIGPQVKVKG